MYHHPYNVKVVNNHAFANKASGLVIGTDGLTGNTIHDIYTANNIFYGNNIKGIRVFGLGAGSSNISFVNNLIYNNIGGTYDFVYGGLPSLVTITGDVLADPQFVNYQLDGSGDFHLKSTSNHLVLYIA